MLVERSLLDVNPQFNGTTAYEYTPELTAFDMLGVALVHGWVVDPSSEHATALGNLSYNQVTDRILSGQTTLSELTELESQLETLEDSSTDREKMHSTIVEKRQVVENAQLLEQFLAESSHQLTLTGLSELLTSTIKNNELCVFFRNNHYGVITRHGDDLYLLITDLGYGESVDVVWERLDMVDGDTELCNAEFVPRRTPDSNPSGPIDADFEMALQLSAAAAQEPSGGGTIAVGVPPVRKTLHQQQEETDRLLAMQLQEQQPPLPTRTVVSNDSALARQWQNRNASTPSIKDCVLM